MEILLVAVVLVLVLGQKSSHNRVRGRRLSDEVNPLATIFMGML